MEWYQILFLIAVVIIVGLLLPWLKKFRAYQFFGLIFSGSLAGYLLNELQHTPSDRFKFAYVACILMFGGIIFRAIKFYKTIK